MKASSLKQGEELEEQAILIANEIFSLINQYTNDSNISKFFLTDEVARACYGLAGGFSSAIFTPILEPEEISDSAIFSFIYALITYGFNIYLKERSLLTNSSPYTVPRQRAEVKKAQRKVLTLTSKGSLTSTPLADKIIRIISENVKTQMEIEEFKVKGHKLSRPKLNTYAKLSLYWGYNFAKELLKNN